MFKRLFGSKSVDDILGIFGVTIAKLNDRAEEMKTEITTQRNIEVEAAAKRTIAATEAIKAEKAAKKIAEFFGA